MNRCNVKQVMFDPAGWVHPAWLPVKSVPEKGELRSVVNQLILRQFDLPAEPDYQPSNGVNRWIVGHWTTLPVGAMLLTALRYRATLSQQGALYRLPASLQQFTRFRLVPPLPAESLNAEPMIWLQAKMADEILGLQPLADAALAARLPLFFPPCRNENRQDQTQPFSSFTPLLLAVQYAERFALSNSWTGGEQCADPAKQHPPPASRQCTTESG